MKKPIAESKCGLCGKNNQESYLVNDVGLKQTDCCLNWVCDDQHKYQLCSFLQNSCDRNHAKYTLCGRHTGNFHKGDWKKCKKCPMEYTKIMYDDYATNKHNFEKLKIEKDEIRCHSCSFSSFDLSNINCIFEN